LAIRWIPQPRWVRWSAAARSSVLGAVAAGIEEGAQLVLGGQVPSGLEHGAYVEPTLLTGASNSMRIAREEIFGPVAVVIPFATNDEAIAIANDSIYGLAAGVWTRDLATAHKMARDIVVWVNCFDHGDMTQPWDGVKQSGTGRDKCLETL
jgi:acyl-CoA reductase-like NAD-dependent aldehyde dehydrogenase